jgi:rSAM/selenodomain-associated transferase 2
MPLVSVVIPVRHDQAALTRLLGQLGPDPRVEVLIADGSDPARREPPPSRPDVRLVHSRPGRGTQMNAGAALATGEWLLFLHADSGLPAGWLDRLEAEAPGHVGGWFRFALDDGAWQARLIEWGVRWRVRLLRLPYGDQGLFVRRDVFQALGGYAELPLMEDVDFVRRLVAAGPVAELPAALTTSARRWRQDGWLRRSGRNMALAFLYWCGVPPSRLAGWYERR